MSNMVVQTNVLALNSHRNMKTIGATQAKASARLSSGYKINSAADDAAGLAISEKMRAQIRGLDMASKNAQDAQSLVQTAEGGMQEIDNMLQRIRELTVQVSNDTNENNGIGTGDRQKIQDEIEQLVEEIDSMAERVEFNKKKVINGDYADANTMLADAQNKVTIAQTANIDASAAVSTITSNALLASTAVVTASGAYSTALSGYTAGTITQSQLENAANAYNNALKTENTLKADGAIASTALLTTSANLVAATSTAADWTAKATAQNATGVKAGLYMQIGANSDQHIQISIGKIKSDVLGIGDGNGKTSIDVVKATGSQITGLLDDLDLALSYVTSERSKLGAASNRMDYTMKSLDISSENLSAAESRIRDADMAKEMMNLTKANVLQQASVAMLAQANQAPQSVLQLLG